MAQKTPVIISDNASSHIPLDGSNTLTVSSIPLSTDSGNLIEARDNGIYYGVTAPADLTYLYVDSVVGDDSNAGTRAAPLKTIARAVAMVPSYQSNTIRLKAGQRYAWPDFVVSGGATRIISLYDDPYVDGDMVQPLTPARPNYDWKTRKFVNRAILVPSFYYTTYNHAYVIRHAQVYGGGRLYIDGCIMETAASNEPGTGLEHESFTANWTRAWPYGMVRGSASGTVTFRGSVFDMRYRPCASQTADPCNETASWISLVFGNDTCPAVQFTNCSHMQLANGETNLGTALIWGTGVTMTFGVANNYDNWTAADAGYDRLDTNISSVPAGNLVIGVVRDANGVPRNVQANVVL
jgi:hypothetical protein